MRYTRASRIGMSFSPFHNGTQRQTQRQRKKIKQNTKELRILLKRKTSRTLNLSPFHLMFMLNHADPPIAPIAGITWPRQWYSRGPPLTEEEVTTGISAPTTEERQPTPPSPPVQLHTTPKWKAKSRMPVWSASVRSASMAVSAHRPSQTSQSPRRSRSPQRTWRPSLRDPSPRGAVSAHGTPAREVKSAASAQGPPWRPSLRALSPQRAGSAHGTPSGEVSSAASAHGRQRAATSAERRTVGLTPAAVRTMQTALISATSPHAKAAATLKRGGDTTQPSQQGRLRSLAELERNFADQFSVLKEARRDGKDSSASASVRFDRDVAAGRSKYLSWLKEKKRLRAAAHRKARLPQRAAERIELEGQWHEEFESGKYVKGEKGLTYAALAANCQEEGDREDLPALKI